jgi:hypothetical protein
MNYDEINNEEIIDLLERTTLALRSKVYDESERSGRSDPKDDELLNESMLVIAKVNGFPSASISHLVRKHFLKDTAHSRKAKR